MNRRWQGWLAPALLLVVGVHAACAPAPSSPSTAAERGMTSSQRDQAQRDYDAVLAAAAAGNHREAQRLAQEFVERFPGAAQEAHVLAVGAREARAAGDPRTAARLAHLLVERHPADPRARDAQQLLTALGAGAAAADTAQREPGHTPEPGADGFRLGLLCPLTGEYALLGQEMHEGAKLAVDDYNRSHDPDVQLLASDTAGDGVKAVLAARELIDVQQVSAVVGDLLTPTTIAVGTLCQERRVPLVSPTATQATIGELGDCIFQSNQTAALETRLLAEAAVGRLLRRRFSILYQDDEEGRAFADMFQSEVERLGAAVVAREGFERTVTDFRDILQRLRAAAPEALFVPCSPNLARLIAPQLPYYQLEVQLLGPSSWNSAALIGEAGGNLERAIFPSEIALMGQDQRDRFAQLWRAERGADQAVSPFALKTYFATSLVLDGVQAGARTAEQVQRHLGAELPARARGAGGDPLASLRVVDEGAIVPFPVGDFPALAGGDPR